MLKPGGTIFSIVLKDNACIDAMYKHSKNTQLYPYTYSLDEKFVFYRTMQNPEETLKNHFLGAGFEVIVNEEIQRVHIPENPETLRGLKIVIVSTVIYIVSILSDLFISVNPFLRGMPASMHKEYVELWMNDIYEVWDKTQPFHSDEIVTVARKPLV